MYMSGIPVHLGQIHNSVKFTLLLNWPRFWMETRSENDSQRQQNIGQSHIEGLKSRDIHDKRIQGVLLIEEILH